MRRSQHRPDVPGHDSAALGDAALGEEALGEDALAEGETGVGMGREHVRGSTLLVVGRVASMVFTVATQILIVRVLTKTEYGGFAYALAMASAARTLLSLGQGRLLSRFMAMYEEQRDYSRMFGCMVLAGGTIAATSTLLIAALFIVQDRLVGTAVDDPAAVDLLLVLAFLAPLEALDQVFVSLFAVFSKPQAIFFRKYLFTPALRLGVVLLLVLTGASVMFLAVGYLAAQVVGLAVYMALLARVLRERNLLQHFRLRGLSMPFRAVFSFSLPLATGELVYLSMNTGSVVLLGYFQSLEDVANYRAVFPSATLNKFIFSSFVTLFLPMAARLFTRRDNEGMRDSYWHTAVFLAVFTYPVFALTGPFAPATTQAMFGVRYADASGVLALLSLGYYVNSALGFNTYTLQVYGRIRFLVVANIVMAVTNIVLGLLLVPWLGAIGVAIANCGTLVLQNVVQQLALRSTIGTAFVERPYLRCYLIIAGVTLVLWGFERAVRPGLVISIGAAAVGSCVVLFLNMRRLQLADTFPELRRIPLLGRWIR